MTGPATVADDAFAEFVATRSQSLLRTACLLTGNWATAEDLLQTALARTYLRWGSINRVESAEAYVRRVLVTTSTTWWRRKWRAEVPTGELPDRPLADDAGRYDDRAALRAALAALPARQRAVVVLRYYEDLPDAEVARILGCSEQTVRSQCSRALGKLRRSPELTEVLPAPAPAAAAEEEGR